MIWSGVVIFAYGGLKGESVTAQFFILGAFIALVMGGSQTINRSLFAQMIPNGKEAEFYAVYEISERGTSWIGPLVFGIANQRFYDLRIGILSLIFVFIAGRVLLPFVNVDKAISDAKKYQEAGFTPELTLPIISMEKHTARITALYVLYLQICIQQVPKIFL